VSGPLPGAHRGPVELEDGDEEQHAGEQGGLAPADQEGQQDGGGERAGDVGARAEGEPAERPGGRARDRQPHDRARTRPHERAAREPTARQVHEPMAGRHEGRDAAAPVVVQPEDQRSEDLARSRDEHDGRHLRALRWRRRADGGEQYEPGRGAYRELAAVAGERLDGERDADVGEHRHGERGRVVQ
jgi:hypothetical protein